MIEPGHCIASRYRLLHLFGQRRIGTVRCAEHISLCSRVAIKLVDPVLARLRRAIARCAIESKAAAKLSIVTGVQVFDCGVEIVIPYIDMEFLAREFRGARINREGRLYAMRPIVVGAAVPVDY